MSDEADKGLAVKATRGVFWVGGGQFVRQLVQMLTAIVLARLLVPEDFGLLGMAIVFVGISQLFADFGIGAAIVQSKETPEIALASSFWLNVLIGLLLVAIICLAAPFIAAFYGDERIEPLIMVLSVTLLLSALMVVPRAILYKELQFQDVVKSQVYGSMVGSLLAIVLALSGFGVWSLVLQPLVGSLMTVVLTFYYSGWRPRLSYSWHSVRSLANFSMPVLGADLMNYAYRNGDSLIIGKILGSQQLGYYSLAYQIMLYPMTQVSSVIVRVLFPTLSKMQDDMQRFSAAYLKSVATISLITFPLMAGLFALADDFILLLFGEKWLPMTDVLRILCWVGLMQSVSTSVGTIYLSTGNPKVSFYFTLFATPLFLGSFLIGVQWGVVGVAAAYAVATLIVSVANFIVAFRLVGIHLIRLVKVLSPPLISSLVMMAGVWYFHGLMLEVVNMQLFARFAISVLLGVIIYAAVSYSINRSQLNEIIAVGRAALSKG